MIEKLDLNFGICDDKKVQIGLSDCICDILYKDDGGAAIVGDSNIIIVYNLFSLNPQVKIIDKGSNKVQLNQYITKDMLENIIDLETETKYYSVRFKNIIREIQDYMQTVGYQHNIEQINIQIEKDRINTFN